MATENLSAAPYAPAPSRPYPMAHAGYGKRSAPDQLPRSADDFMLLPPRERSIAGFIDHLPDGAAMDVKSLAKQLPLYGQQAVSTALKALSIAGYLRRVRCLVGESGQVRWVFRTFWSRTARDNEWWATLLTDERKLPTAAEPAAVIQPDVAAVVPQQQRRTPEEPAPPVREDGPSPAYAALAQLGRTDARLGLSHADCVHLEPLAAAWFARGVDADYLVQALVAGLPTPVASPPGLVRRRLTDKIPPQLPTAPVPPAPGTPVHQVMLECTKCRVPGPPEALPDGLCRPCRQTEHDAPAAPEAPTGLPSERDVHAYVAGLRDLLKTP